MQATLEAPSPTNVFDRDGRLVCQRLAGDGSVVEWLELPSSLKQPLMAMVAEVAEKRVATTDFPVPGGDKLVVRRGEGGGVLLERLPVGFPSEGREIEVAAAAVPLFLVQVRAV